MNAGTYPHRHLKYRPDIDGLRALAILSVVLYHAFPTTMRGGFIGVDIFFVISGYLISSIIFKGLRAGDFSFTDFYQRRVNRIFPALMLVLVTCYVVGWFTLISTEFKMLGKHLAGSVGFVQNLVLCEEDGYFDTASDLKPLLHLWSLGVEEQFYILFPLAAWALWRWRIAALPIIVGTVLVSFCAGVHILTVSRSAAFYMPQYRFWEILVGSIAAYHGIFHGISSSRIHNSAAARNVLSLSGGVLLIASVVVIDKDSVFPGFLALLPVSGSVLMIVAGPQAWLNKHVMANRMLVSIGLISYPLYLWHWVVITYMRIVGANELDFIGAMLAIFISLILAVLTYKFVELPFRKARIRVPKAALLLAFGVTVGAAGVWTFVQNGLPFRPGTDVDERTEYAQYFENSLPDWAYATKQGLLEAYRIECDFFDVESYRAGKITMEPRKAINTDCYIPKTGIKVMIWGDSHAQQYNFGLRKVLPTSISILQVASSGCVANFPSSTPGSRKYCNRSNAFAFQVMEKEKPTVLVIGQSEGHDTANNLTALTARAKLLGVKAVIVVGPVPHYAPFLYQVVVRKYWNHTPKRTKENLMVAASRSDTALQHKYVRGAGGFDYLSAMDAFCNKEGCMIYVGDDRKAGLVTYDYGHLTPPASLYFAQTALAPLIMRHLDPLLAGHHP